MSNPTPTPTAAAVPDAATGWLGVGGGERRQHQPRRNPLFRALRGTLVGGFIVALLAVMGIGLMATVAPQLTGPAYFALITAIVVLIVVMVLMVTRKVVVMVLERRGKLKNARLQVRILGIFSLLAVVPTLTVALVSGYLIQGGIESWFNAKVSSALEGSLQVAEAYLDEHERNLLIEVDGLSKANFWQYSVMLPDNSELTGWLRGQMQRSRLDELAVLDDKGAVIAVGSGLRGVSLPPELAAMLGASGSATTFKNVQDGWVVGIAPLHGGNWLLAQRWVNPVVLGRVDQTNAAFTEYASLREHVASIRLISWLLLIVLTMGALMGVVWVGMLLGNKIVQPVTRLVHATNRVSQGDLAVRLTPDNDDELGVLTLSFNRMAQQLQHNRDLLERKNKELDERRKLMDSVLTGVTAGVVSVDASGVIKWLNHPAQDVLALKVGQRLAHTTPQLAELFEQLTLHPRPVLQQQVKVEVPDGTQRALLVRLVPQLQDGVVHSAVLTFDDITPLISAQRLAAWQEVARRLAHEIKNPLTPIQLSAERLRRKYLDKMPTADQPLFAELTQTIVTQSEDMRRMTNEFSDFARMPNAVLAPEHLLDLVHQAVVLQQSAGRGATISIETTLTPQTDELWCDRAQINRVLTNVLENALQAIEEKRQLEAENPPTAKKKGNNLWQGEVKVVVKKPQADMVQLEILDNGKGLPPHHEAEQLFDPYVTTKTHGTGLGLAIVRRVMDEHGGSVSLAARPSGGARVVLTLPVRPATV